MTDARRFLDRVRARLDHQEQPRLAPIERARAAIPDPLRRFHVELTAAGGYFHRAAEGSVGDAVAGILAPLREPRVVITREDEVSAARGAVEASGGRVLWWPEVGRRGAADADAGLTAALWGVAETGSVVVSSAAPGGRSPSLLPPVHIAILAAPRLVGTVAELLERIAAMPERPSNLVIVTGPSKTADIEMELVKGVHGPEEMHVVVVDQS